MQNIRCLIAASNAYYGFSGLDQYDRKDFEVRFYDSHADAVEFRTSFTENLAGEKAVVKSNENACAVGIKNA